MCRILKSAAFLVRSGTIGRVNDHKWMMSIPPHPKASNLITLWPWHVNADSDAKVIDYKEHVCRTVCYVSRIKGYTEEVRQSMGLYAH